MNGTRAAGIAAVVGAISYILCFALHGMLPGPSGYGCAGVDAAAMLANVALEDALVLAEADKTPAAHLLHALHFVEMGIGGTMELLRAGWIGLASRSLSRNGDVPGCSKPSG